MSKKCNNNSCSGSCSPAIGPRGARGYQGPQGIPGPQGIGSGTPGTQGQTGSTGATGATGSTGPTGPTGPAGPAPNLAIGAVTTLPPGTPGTVTVSGTNPNYQLNMNLPSGTQGIQGVTGTAGTNGLHGNPGSNSLIYKRGDGIAQGTVSFNATFALTSTISISKTCLLGYGTNVTAPSGTAGSWLSAINLRTIIQISNSSDFTKFVACKVLYYVEYPTYFVFTVNPLAANGSQVTATDEVIISYSLAGLDAIPVNNIVAGEVANAGVGLVPVGTIIPWAGKASGSLPNGWLLCDGSYKLKTDYPTLFSVIGNVYDIATNVLAFAVPDLMDSIPYGSAATQVGVKVGVNVTSPAVVGSPLINVVTTAGTVSVSTDNRQKGLSMRYLIKF